ncbi:hypothetical protein DYU11_30640 [Fibrisoma montanum]|uniref:JAB domain-containing protein n=1 Tax=Fibrisoma montanum TaxID=2305895 RepID=A0A418LXA1_9BACT|nr:hypothetical protein [Fibrisoma montanum]RIV17836.1 hypothetical protein DYU11_30640 [Fibrisoma montanum]
MYDRQSSTDKEQAALVTDHGIYWLSDSGNSHDHFTIGPDSDYPVDANGKRYFMDNGQKVIIQSIVHTHPSSGPQSGPGMSVEDIKLADDFNVPVYAIHISGVYKANGSGTVSTAATYMNAAFDCAIAKTLFEL